MLQSLIQHKAILWTAYFKFFKKAWILFPTEPFTFVWHNLGCNQLWVFSQLQSSTIIIQDSIHFTFNNIICNPKYKFKKLNVNEQYLSSCYFFNKNASLTNVKQKLGILYSYNLFVIMKVYLIFGKSTTKRLDPLVMDNVLQYNTPQIG